MDVVGNVEELRLRMVYPQIQNWKLVVQKNSKNGIKTIIMYNINIIITKNFKIVRDLEMHFYDMGVG